MIVLPESWWMNPSSPSSSSSWWPSCPSGAGHGGGWHAVLPFGSTPLCWWWLAVKHLSDSNSNFTISIQNRLTFTIHAIVVAVDIAAFLLNQSIGYTYSKDHIYTHDTAQGWNNNIAAKTEIRTEMRHKMENWKWTPVHIDLSLWLVSYCCRLVIGSYWFYSRWQRLTIVNATTQSYIRSTFSLSRQINELFFNFLLDKATSLLELTLCIDPWVHACLACWIQPWFMYSSPRAWPILRRYGTGPWRRVHVDINMIVLLHRVGRGRLYLPCWAALNSGLWLYQVSPPNNNVLSSKTAWSTRTSFLHGLRP